MIRACTSIRIASPPIANETASPAFEGYLRRLGLLDDERAAAVREEALALMRAGIEAAEAEPPGDPELVFAHAYADPPPALVRDLEDLRRVHGL